MERPRYPWKMDAPQPLDAAAKANLEKAAKAIYEVTQMKQQFFQCHEFLTKNTYRLVELLREAESRGLLLDEALTLADTSFWLQLIDWQSKFLTLVLNFAKDPNRRSLRPLIELYGRDRDRMRAEVEILERQLEHRLAMFAKPDDALVRKAVMKNQQRVLAVYLHLRSGFRGIDLARFFKVPKTTAYGWLDWFKTLPEGLQTGIVAFMDSQAHSMAACQMPTVVPKPANSPEQAPQGLNDSASPDGIGVGRGARWCCAWGLFLMHPETPEIVGTRLGGEAFCNTALHPRDSAGFDAQAAETVPRLPSRCAKIGGVGRAAAGRNAADSTHEQHQNRRKVRISKPASEPRD